MSLRCICPSIRGQSTQACRLLQRCLALSRWLLAALGIGAGLDVRNFRTCLHLLPYLGDGLVVGLHLLGYLVVRCLRLRLEHLGDKVALLFGGEVATVDVCRENVAVWVIRV